jgi:hypothetical protein
MEKHIPRISYEQQELAINFYDMACDYPRESFEMITKRLLPRGFGKSKSVGVFKKQAKKMFDLARRQSITAYHDCAS